MAEETGLFDFVEAESEDIVGNSCINTHDVLASGDSMQYERRCRCRKTPAFWSALLDESFCSDDCYDIARKQYAEIERTTSRDAVSAP